MKLEQLGTVFRHCGISYCRQLGSDAGGIEEGWCRDHRPNYRITGLPILKSFLRHNPMNCTSHLLWAKQNWRILLLYRVLRLFLGASYLACMTAW